MSKLPVTVPGLGTVGRNGQHTDGISVNSRKDKSLPPLAYKVFDIMHLLRSGWLFFSKKKKVIIKGFA